MNVIKNVQLKNEVFILSNCNLVLTTCYGKKNRKVISYIHIDSWRIYGWFFPFPWNHRFAISLNHLTHSKSKSDAHHTLNPPGFFLHLDQKKSVSCFSPKEINERLNGPCHNSSLLVPSCMVHMKVSYIWQKSTMIRSFFTTTSRN